MTDRNIKRFIATGIVPSTTKLRWIGWEQNLRATMAARGFVPVLEIQPVRQTAYIPDKEKYNWRLVIQGVYIGKRKAEKFEGMLHGQLIPRRTTSSKSARSSEQSESK